MLTFRSSLIIATSLWGLMGALINRQEALALLCVSFLVWLWFEWVCFQRFNRDPAGLINHCKRTINGNSDRSITLVAEQSYDVQLRGVISRRSRGYRLLVQDTVADTFQRSRGTELAILDPCANTKLQIEYNIESPMCGRMHLPGLRVEVTDYWGFFRKDLFVPVPQELTVLPYLIRPQTTVSALKHNNLQRQIGHHRHRSSGVSSELLGIRDYRLGDPPKTVAWKATARLGKVMTREFENEVPIRSTIIVDLGAYQFQGRPRLAAADRAILGCASLARLLLADRDPVATILLRDYSSQRVDHGGGERHLTRILQALLSASNPNPSLESLPLDVLVRVLFENAAQRFPRLFDDQINRGPSRRSWFFRAQDRVLRRQLAVVLEHLLELPVGSSTKLQYDDQALRDCCRRYVDRYSVVSTATSVQLQHDRDDTSRWRSDCARMSWSLCSHLSNARSRAKDNELFVLIAPGPIHHDGIDELENTLRTVVGARHRVVFVAPQKPKLPREYFDPLVAEIFQQASQSPYGEPNREADDPFRPEGVALEFQRMLTRLGVAYGELGEPSMMQAVASEIGVLRSGKRRAQIVRGR